MRIRTNKRKNQDIGKIRQITVRFPEKNSQVVSICHQLYTSIEFPMFHIVQFGSCMGSIQFQKQDENKMAELKLVQEWLVPWLEPMLDGMLDYW